MHSPVITTTTGSAHKMAVIPEFHPVTVIDPEPCHASAVTSEPFHAMIDESRTTGNGQEQD